MIMLGPGIDIIPLTEPNITALRSCYPNGRITGRIKFAQYMCEEDTEPYRVFMPDDNAYERAGPFYRQMFYHDQLFQTMLANGVEWVELELANDGYMYYYPLQADSGEKIEYLQGLDNPRRAPPLPINSQVHTRTPELADLAFMYRVVEAGLHIIEGGQGVPLNYFLFQNGMAELGAGVALVKQWDDQQEIMATYALLCADRYRPSPSCASEHLDHDKRNGMYKLEIKGVRWGYDRFDFAVMERAIHNAFRSVYKPDEVIELTAPKLAFEFRRCSILADHRMPRTA